MPKGWKPPKGWQIFFSPGELATPPPLQSIYDRVSKAQAEIEAARMHSGVPRQNEKTMKTTGFGIDWADVERQAKRDLGKRLLGKE